MSDYISHDHEHDGVDRRGFLKCMAWAGAGVLWTMSGGVLKSYGLGHAMSGHSIKPTGAHGDWSFAQISDSHMGFNKAANPDVLDTFRQAVARVSAASPA